MTKTVVAFGTFDIIHPGHIAYLTYAQKFGTRLVVVVTPDAAVRRRKGSPPLFPQSDRLRIVENMKGVTKVILGDNDDSWTKVMSIHADCVCFGYDQGLALRAFKKALTGETLRRITIRRAPAFGPRRYHSKNLKRFLMK